MGASPEIAPPRVVLDTNVALSALLFARGRLAGLRSAWQQGRFVPLLSRETADELIAALAYPKFKLTTDDRRDLLAEYLPWCEVVVLPKRPPTVPDCRGLADLPFLRLAVSGAADALVTGERDLLALADAFAIPIIPPAEFLRRLGG